MIIFNEKFFDECIKLNRGFDLPNNKIKQGIYPIVASTNIKAYHKIFKVKGPGVVTGRSGSLGVVQYIPDDFWPLNTSLYVKDFKGNDPKYIFYLLSTMQLENFNSGSSVPTLNQNHLHKQKIKIPNLFFQQRIASILSSYDELIETNNQRIKLLEETARELYKEWFIRMRFPGYKQVKFIKGIPQSWKIKKLGEIIELAYGKALKEEDRVEGKNLVYGSSGIVGTHTAYISKAPGIVVGRKGNVGSVYWVTKDFYPIDTAFYVKTELNLYYTYYNLHHQNFIDGDAAVPGLNRNQAYSNSILIPSEDLLIKFTSIVEPIFNQIDNLNIQNTQLKEIRDRLLPRLISGKLQLKSQQEDKQ